MSTLITDQLFSFISRMGAAKGTDGPGSPSKQPSVAQSTRGKKGAQAGAQPELQEADLNPSRLVPGAQPMSGVSGQSVEDKRGNVTVQHSLASLTSGLFARARAVMSSVGKFLPGASPVPAAAASAPPQSPRVAMRGRYVTFADCATPGPERPQGFAGAPEIEPEGEILEADGAGATAGAAPAWHAVRDAARTPYGSGNPRCGPRGLYDSDLARADGFGSIGSGSAAGMVGNLQKDVLKGQGAQEAYAKQHMDQMAGVNQSMAAIMDKAEEQARLIRDLQAAITRIEQVSPACDGRVLTVAGAPEGRPPGLKSLKPNKFSGKGSQAEALAWYAVTERYAQTHGCRVADAADYLMDGRARVWLVDLRSLYAVQQKALDDEAFKAEFVREYAQDRAELRREAREQILHGRLVMFADETVARYRNRAVLLFHKAGYNEEEDQIYWVLQGMKANHSALHAECILSAAGKRHTSLQALWGHALEREQMLKDLSAGTRQAGGGSGGARPWGAQRDKGAARAGDGGKGGRSFGKHRSFGSNGSGPSFGPQLAVAQAQKRGAGPSDEDRPTKAVKMDVDAAAPTVAVAMGGAGTPPGRRGPRPDRPPAKWCDKTGKLWDYRDCVPIDAMQDTEKAQQARAACIAAGACFKCYRKHLAGQCTFA